MVDGYILVNGTFVLPDGLLEGGTLVVREGKIARVSGASLAEHLEREPRDRGLPAIDCSGAFVMPRLVEMHIHGAFGVGFEKATGADLRKVAAEFEKRGVGCFQPTILWDEEAVGRLARAIDESGLPRSALPGIYLEGPFINPEKKGGINLPQISAPSAELCRKILATAKGKLRIMALAPELPGIEEIYPILREAGVLVSLGHSGASAGVALPPPPFSVTHLFNAMSGLDHRSGGIANLALAGRSAWAELNADGIHVNATCMKVASLCVPPEKLVLTSDAVISAGLPFGNYSYFGKPVISGEKGVRYRETGTLIGSSRTGMEIVKSFAAATGVPLCAAVASMSRTPSALLNLGAEDCGGVISEGAKADLFLWDRSLSSCARPAAPEGAGSSPREIP